MPKNRYKPEQIVERNPGIHSLGQWAGVRGPGVAEVAGKSGDGDFVYRARQSVGERVVRELQRQAAGRMPERRDSLFAEGGASRDRAVAGGVQHAAPALGARLSAAGARGIRNPCSVGGCAINSLTRRGTKTRSGQVQRR